MLSCQDPKDKDFLKRARSLMVISVTQPTQNYEEFNNKVLEYCDKEPFNFNTAPFLKNSTLNLSKVKLFYLGK